jgi:localization factor PodJL
MARAYPASQPQDYDPHRPAGEWQSLRGELVALLDQVESQVARTRRYDDTGHAVGTERLRAFGAPPSEAQPDERHREALRSVRRAVDRFNERDESFAANPRDTLQSAIRQIRDTQGLPLGARAAAPRAPEAPRFDELAGAVGGISGRLERLEGELRVATTSQTGNVKEIAEQVAQLSHVVELLAGAVGETGQVKRLEAQIAGLANLVAQGPQIDFSGLTQRLDELSHTIVSLNEKQRNEGLAQRLDDVTATMGRLADLQVQFANRVDNSAKAAGGLREGLAAIENGVRSVYERIDSAPQRDGMAAIEQSIRAIHERLEVLPPAGESVAALEAGIRGLYERVEATPQSHRDGMAAIEASIRALAEKLEDGPGAGLAAIETSIRGIYDRIDSIERATAMPAPELDQLTQGMAALTAALRHPVQPEGVVELVEEISTRLNAIDSSNRDVGALKLDVEALRGAVLDAMEPRFSALEQRLETLADRMAETRGEVSVGQLEAQVRQLVARMDQTGEQLTGLARLYAQPAEREPAQDFGALADMVAERTSAAVAARTSGEAAGLDAAGLDEIERRVSRLMDVAVRERPADDFGGIESSIREVSERLARLERSLAEPAREAAPAMPAAVAPVVVAAPALPAEPAPRPRSDAMPANPAIESPLRDRPFGDDSGPLKSALDAKTGRGHPGLRADPLPEAPRPAFDPDKVERPPRPVSAFDLPAGSSFEPAAAEAAPEAPAEMPASTNTFIAAARRAAQRQQQTRAPAAPAGNSLIARAFSNFQAGKEAADAPPAEPPAKPAKAKRTKPEAAATEPVAKEEKRSRGLFGFGGKKEAAEAPTIEPLVAEVAAEPSAPEPIALDHEVTAPNDAEAPQESFLSRHRRPILLAASIVAIAFLTLNLVNQRLAPSEANGTRPATANVSAVKPAVAPATLSGTPIAATVPANGPRSAPLIDAAATTASIDPAAATGFTPSSAAPTMPSAFAALQPVDAALPDITGAATQAIELAALGTDSRTEPVAALASPVQLDMPPAAVGPEALRAAAANGDARAQFEVAAIFTEGRAVPEDLAAAAVWYERAAAQGFAPAQYRLGNLYENGRGVAKDLQQARLWYHRAAEAGNRMAMHNLAALYAGGDLGSQDFDSAAKWFEEAAQRGMRDSQFNLGMLYARGLGVPQSFEQSYRWFSLAANKGDPDATKARDDIAGSLDAEAVGRVKAEIAAYRFAAIDLAANFAPIGTWNAKFDPGEAIASTDVVKSVQMALSGLGYDVGTPDGLMGPKTADAIKSFERSTGMSEVGKVNPRLLAVLGSQPV